MTPDELAALVRADTLPEGVEIHRSEHGMVLTCSHCRAGRYEACERCPDNPTQRHGAAQGEQKQ